MQKETTTIEGVYLLKPTTFTDIRGVFVKTFSKELYEQLSIDPQIEESFYSTSHKDVLRGMHFHLPPKEHTKLVYVVSGSIRDVVLDLRKESKTYGKTFQATLSENNKHIIYIPKGCAHGFLSLEDNTTTVYMQSGGYSKEHDSGVNPLSIGVDWGISNPILSERDNAFVSLDDFKSPF
jgi:dTDP-4-dehydrorhamnose 3,5-epimerase/CDP-3, 6-dideoxy-D-glycero-D-glycero-4-hexulose-5-epimerase